MADELIFYTNPMSRGRTVGWMLEEVGTPYRTEILDYDGAMKSPEYLAINPMGKVPAIVHRGTVVTEVAAICAYLADAFPEKGLAPAADSAERGSYYRWLFFAAAPLEAAIVNSVLGVQVAPEQKRMVGYGSLETVLDTIETAVDGREYLSGKRFGAADLYLAALLGFGMRMNVVEKRPALQAYCSRFQDRPAFLRAQEIDGERSPTNSSAAR